jgi:hypothetical protein
MRNSYIAKDAEALNLHNGSQTAIVFKMKSQPEDGFYIHKGIGWDGKEYFEERKGTLYKLPTLKPPYALGKDVYVRESCFSYTLDKETKFAYKDSTGEIAKLELAIYLHEDQYAPIRFGSAATMPKSAARTRFKIVSCEAVRVKDMEWNQVCSLGFVDPYTFELYFISRFGQSAWDNNQFIWFYKIDKI